MKIPGISETSYTKIIELFKSFNEIEEVILYGSRAMGTFHEGSDIDLSLTGNELTTSLLIKIESLFDDLLLPYKADLSIFHHISNSDLIDHIQRVGISIYQKTSA